MDISFGLEFFPAIQLFNRTSSQFYIFLSCSEFFHFLPKNKWDLISSLKGRWLAYLLLYHVLYRLFIHLKFSVQHQFPPKNAFLFISAYQNFISSFLFSFLFFFSLNFLTFFLYLNFSFVLLIDFPTSDFQIICPFLSTFFFLFLSLHKCHSFFPVLPFTAILMKMFNQHFSKNTYKIFLYVFPVLSNS